MSGAMTSPPACLHGVGRDILQLTVIFRIFLDYSFLSMFIALFFYVCTDRERLMSVVILIDALRDREGV
jgi:hypothetical protein